MGSGILTLPESPEIPEISIPKRDPHPWSALLRDTPKGASSLAEAFNNNSQQNCAPETSPPNRARSQDNCFLSFIPLTLSTHTYLIIKKKKTLGILIF